MPDITITLSDEEYATAETLAVEGTGALDGEPNLTADEFIVWQIKEYLRVKGKTLIDRELAAMTEDDMADFKAWKEDKDKDKDT